MASDVVKGCLFCKVVQEQSDFIYEDDNFVCFKDIKPASTFHYLVIPKKHVGNPSTLNSSDVHLVQQLLSIGEQVFRDQNVCIEDSRFGFHLPPFNSIQHLHLHCIAPVGEMGFISRLIFRPNSFWFIKTSDLIERISKIQAPQ